MAPDFLLSHPRFAAIKHSVAASDRIGCLQLWQIFLGREALFCDRTDRRNRLGVAESSRKTSCRDGQDQRRALPAPHLNLQNITSIIIFLFSLFHSFFFGFHWIRRMCCGGGVAFYVGRTNVVRFFGFLVCYIATPLTLQLRQDRIQVVYSNKVAQKRLTESGR